MSKYLKIVTIFLAALVVMAGCDFGKAPNMDQVRDTLMAEYGDQVFTEEELYGEEFVDGEEVAEGADEIFEYSNDCDEECQTEFENYMELMCEWFPDDYCENCDQACRVIEFEAFMDLKDIFEQPAT